MLTISVQNFQTAKAGNVATTHQKFSYVVLEDGKGNEVSLYFNGERCAQAAQLVSDAINDAIALSAPSRYENEDALT